jgi:hypothetical protein
MYRFSVTWFIFNLQRREYNFFELQHGKQVHDIKCMCGVYKCKKITLIHGKVYEEANFHPCWPHAERQLPRF